MEATFGLTLVALGAAAVAGYQGGQWALEAVEVRTRSRAALYDRTSPLAWLLLHGLPPAMPLARRLLRVKAVARFGDYLIGIVSSRGLATTPEAIVSHSLGLVGLVALVAGLLSGSALCAIAVAICAVAIGLTLAGSARDRSIENLRAAIPDVLRSMAVCSKAGLSLQQTLEQTASETTGKLRRLFEQAARRLSTGEAPDEALAVLRNHQGLSGLSFVAVALDVQHQCGGSLSTVLEAAGDTVEGELELARSLKVQTAQAKLSARIVTLMPFVLIALFTLLSPDFLSPFFSSFAGMALLCIALGMQGAGVFAVRRILRVETD